MYGPFRDAVDVRIVGGGDRKGYQQDWHNAREALAEVEADLAQGADMVMVKPALAYLDIIAAVRATTNVPVAAYHVSGEYAMIKAAAANGWIDGPAVAFEHLSGYPFPELAALDNEEMLEAGRRRGEDGLEWQAGNAECLPFGDAMADGYVIGFGVRNVTDVPKALSDARDHVNSSRARTESGIPLTERRDASQSARTTPLRSRQRGRHQKTASIGRSMRGEKRGSRTSQARSGGGRWRRAPRTSAWLRFTRRASAASRPNEATSARRFASPSPISPTAGSREPDSVATERRRPPTPGWASSNSTR